MSLQNENFNRIVKQVKEYNMWACNVWTDAPQITRVKTESEWVDLPRISPSWASPAKNGTWTPPKRSKPRYPTPPPSRPGTPEPTSYTPPLLSAPPSPQPCGPSTSSTPPRDVQISPKQWVTPEKSGDLSFDLDSSPRTSTPCSDESLEEDFSLGEHSYDHFKNRLQGSPRQFKIRGAVVYENDSMISGHIDMKSMDPFSYTFEEQYMPRVNYCMLNLLLNGLAPLMCQEHYEPSNPNPFVADCQCLPACNCRARITVNRNLPIGYKYNEDGFVVPSAPFLPPRPHRRDPTCIYTG